MDNAIGMEVLERQDCFVEIHSALRFLNVRHQYWREYSTVSFSVLVHLIL